MYHVNDDGDVKTCRARVKPCRFALHGETVEEAQVLYESNTGEKAFFTVKKSSKSVTAIQNGGQIEEFTRESFYGKQVPRDVQFDAMNGVAAELEENDATQLVAACGTGKTFMHRQLLRQAMEKPDSTGIGVILTSSIRLAHDTAHDLRPTGGYDESFGKFGEDYEVVEVHSDARPEEGRKSVRSDGVINVERIYTQIDEALKSGKKVVIVSTYDSVSKVQEAQELFADQNAAKVDLLIHDEAHNILGQQKPTTVASDENELTAYVGFHNDIPKSLQASKRLYSTATPIVRETESDKEPTGELADLIVSSNKMQDGDQYERVTVYSDDPMVGKIGGFISQEVAIESKCLAKPAYEIRESVINGSLNKFEDPVVDFNGKLRERLNGNREELSPKTYGALVATLNAMAADAEGDKNSATNVLAYVGSIDQSEGFKKAFKEVALIESAGMSLADAERKINSSDLIERRQARMRMLAENAMVKAAHSRTDSNSVNERREAFEMFDGNAVKSNEWTPHKRVLANVNIFSEGVSISEIDAVVISDDDKLNEKSMTQAIGRAIRVVPGNDVKKYGRVIIPSVEDSSGMKLNSSSVNLAAYTSTRVERGSTASKLRGEAIKADTTTNFTVYKSDGSQEDRLARYFAQNSVTRVEDLAVAAEVNANHIYLLAKDPNYKNLSKNEQFVLAKERVNEKLMRLKRDSPSLSYLTKVQADIANKSPREIQEIARNGRVVSAALASGDVSSLNPKLAADLIDKNILQTNQKTAEVTVDEKREYLKKYEKEFALAILTKPANSTQEHNYVRASLPLSVLNNKRTLSETIRGLKNNSPESESTRNLNEAFSQFLENEDFVTKAYSVIENLDKSKVSVLGWVSTSASIENDKKALDQANLERQREDAVRGELTYIVDPESVRKSGELKSAALKRLLDEGF